MQTVLTVLFPILLAGPPRADTEEARFFFIQITDPQLGYAEANKSMAPEVRDLERAVAAVNRLKPAFVVVTGDLVNQAGDDAQAREYRRIMGGIDRTITVRAIPGNHDIGNIPTPRSIAWARTAFGPDRGSFIHGGWRFILLDTTILHNPRDCPAEAAEEKAWLREELRKVREEGIPAILFQHHAWFLQEPGEPAGYENLPLDLRKEFLPLLAEAGVKAVFAGHAHKSALARSGSLEMVTTCSLAKPAGKEPPGLCIVWVFRDRIAHEYFGLDAVPATVDLKGPAARRRL